MKTFWLAVAIVFVCLCPEGANAGPSFDCAKAHTEVEKLICANSELAELDVELADIYQAALRKAKIEEESQIGWIKELQVDWIKHREDCFRPGDNPDPQNCLRNRITQRIADLGGPSEFPFVGILPSESAATHKNWPMPSVKETREVCAYIAARGPAIADELIEEGTLHANNSAAEYDVSIETGSGSAGGDYSVFRPKGEGPNSPSIDTGVKGFDPVEFGGFGTRWFKRGNHVYLLQFDTESLRHVLYLSYIDPQNIEHIACDFEVSETEHLRPDQKDDGLCRQVAEHKVKYAPIEAVSPETQAEDAHRSGAKMTGRVTVDFSNTGRPETLALIDYIWTGGRGCGFSYFEATKDGSPDANGDRHPLLMLLQNVNLDNYRNPGPTCSGNYPNWFEYNGNVYFDNHTDYSSSTPTHEVKYAKGAQVELVCHGEFDVKWRVNSIWPHL